MKTRPIRSTLNRHKRLAVQGVAEEEAVITIGIKRKERHHRRTPLDEVVGTENIPARNIAIRAVVGMVGNRSIIHRGIDEEWSWMIVSIGTEDTERIAANALSITQKDNNYLYNNNNIIKWYQQGPEAGEPYHPSGTK